MAEPTRNPSEAPRQESREGAARTRMQGKEPHRAAGAGEKGSERRGETQRKHSSKTSGSNRDFDESGTSANQGHGHTRGEQASRAPRENE